MKAITLHSLEIEAILKGASSLLVVIDESKIVDTIENYLKWDNEDVAIQNYSLLQVGDTFYVQGATIKDLVVESVEVKRVRDLSIYDARKLLGMNWIEVSEVSPSDWFNQIHGEGSYEANPYVFIINFKAKGE